MSACERKLNSSFISRRHLILLLVYDIPYQEKQEYVAQGILATGFFLGEGGGEGVPGFSFWMGLINHPTHQRSGAFFNLNIQRSI